MRPVRSADINTKNQFAVWEPHLVYFSCEKGDFLLYPAAVTPVLDPTTPRALLPLQ